MDTRNMENIFNEVRAGKFPSLQKETDIQTQVAVRTPNSLH